MQFAHFFTVLAHLVLQQGLHTIGGETILFGELGEGVAIIFTSTITTSTKPDIALLVFHDCCHPIRSGLITWHFHSRDGQGESGESGAVIPGNSAPCTHPQGTGSIEHDMGNTVMTQALLAGEIRKCSSIIFGKTSVRAKPHISCFVFRHTHHRIST